MIWDEIEQLIEQAKQAEISSPLIARQIASEGYNTYYSFFRQLAIHEQNQGVILEIGVYRGCTAAHVVDACAWHKHIHLGVDINPVNFSHPNFIFIQADATDEAISHQVKKVADYYGGIFAVFQDSSHHYDASVKEWELYSPMVRPGGIWVSDDVTESFIRAGIDAKSMAGYFEDLPGDKRIYDDLHIGSKMGIVLL